MKKIMLICALIISDKIYSETIFKLNGNNSFKVEERFDSYEFGEWVNINSEINNENPIISNQKNDFLQSYIEIQNQKRDKIGVKEINGEIRKTIIGEENRIIEENKERTINVEVTNQNKNERNCSEWIPLASDFNILEKVSQTSTCDYDNELIYTYKFENNILGTYFEIVDVVQNTKNREIMGTKAVTIFANNKGSDFVPEGLDSGCTYEYLESILKVASGNQCIFSIKLQNILSYTIDPNKKTVIELYASVYANTGGYSYITDGAPSALSDNGSNGFGGLVYIAGYPAFFGYPCSNMSNCPRGATNSRVTINNHTDITRYKFVYQNGMLSYYVNDSLLKTLPKSYKANNALDIGVNKGHIHIGEIKIYSE